MERVDVNDRCGGMETKRTLVVQSRIEEEEIRVLDQDDDDNNNEWSKAPRVSERIRGLDWNKMNKG